VLLLLLGRSTKLLSPARNSCTNRGLGKRPERWPSAANRTEVSHEEEYPGLMIIDAYSDLHGPQIRMRLKLAKGLNLLHANLLNSAREFRPSLYSSAPMAEGGTLV